MSSLFSKTAAALAATALLVIPLSGCSEESDASRNLSPYSNDESSEFKVLSSSGIQNVGDYGNDWIREMTVQTSDGRHATCLAFYGNERGGFSCDWDSPSSPQPSSTMKDDKKESDK